MVSSGARANSFRSKSADATALDNSADTCPSHDRRSSLRRRSLLTRIASVARRASARAPVVSFQAGQCVDEKCSGGATEATPAGQARGCQSLRSRGDAPPRTWESGSCWPRCIPASVEEMPGCGALDSGLPHSFEHTQVVSLPINACASPRSTHTGSITLSPRSLGGHSTGGAPKRGACEVFMLYASPLYHPPINFRSEAAMLSQVFASVSVRFKTSVATAGSLTKLLAIARSRKGIVLHLSAHTVQHAEHGLGLVVEDPCGGPHILWRNQLEELLSSGDVLNNISLLFLSTCHSDELAQVFVECGCKHVIATRKEVHDSAARRFSTHFYYELAMQANLLKAWEGARQTLRLDSDVQIAANADHFMLYGQRGAEQATLERLCGLDAPPNVRPGPDLTMGNFEDVDDFLDSGLPTRIENFCGRTQMIHSIGNMFYGPQGRRICVIHGPEGIGKSALGVEFAHFTVAPGRLFSCAARVVNIRVTSMDSIVGLFEDHLEDLADQLRVPLRPCTADSRGSVISRSSTVASNCSERSVTPFDSPFEDGLTYQDLARARIRRGFQQIERSRRLSRMLFVLDDGAGVVASSAEVRNLLGEILDSTNNVHFLILSRMPVYFPLGSTKVVNVQLPGLTETESAKLFLQRIHRRLETRDFVVELGSEIPGAAVTAPRGNSPVYGPVSQSGGQSSVERTAAQLFGHPLMRRIGGNPGRISVVSSSVTPGGLSLHELAALDGPCLGSPVAAPAQRQGSVPAPRQVAGVDQLLLPYVASVERPALVGSR
eukprot:TRINITY_DN39140_c0_g1_i1.p1 TRINITY_DN39140_c0_g1~~TRINITY_DN39140_c0_g1_i1.p1  ORF type:complete len:776 (-),score=100.03 TRINITY_DN39140_c0_g1_i1:231-2558(-)